ncbi:MAG: hypothetical protein CMO34_02755 [Verrucomicrobia bacterium]|nr:hypothetical protein [Verrucomicrobiota bacterium]|tara:strand:+ start:1110 stop:1343 length:234 start_codon:yes stop_codon:yes gene_type:complete
MINKSKSFFLLTCLFLLFGCSNPYKGFKGVETKGMKKKKLPSQQLRDDYDKASKKMVRAYKKEQKKTKRRLGSEVKE